MHLAVKLLLLLLLVQSLLAAISAEPIFAPASLSNAEFKGLPRLATLNRTMGERRIVYHHDQLVGVVDVNGRRLLRCELVEVYELDEADELLKNLTAMSLTPHAISFRDMIKLMDKCDQLDDHPGRSQALTSSVMEKSMGGNPLLFGIIPGTKWCGTGDIAKSYHDLGSRTKIDRCCRAHDLCPVKIRAHKTRYNLDNHSFFSKSHCTCEEYFFNCLKTINHVSANIIGNIYFNIAQPACIDEDPLDGKDSIKKFVFVSSTKVFLCNFVERTHCKFQGWQCNNNWTYQLLNTS